MSTQPPGPREIAAAKASILCLINHARRNAHRRPVRLNSKLSAVEQSYAQAMVKQQFFSHTSPHRSTFISRAVSTGYPRGTIAWGLAENIAYGEDYSGSPQDIFASWMLSYEHRVNLLGSGYTDIGIGISAGTPDHTHGATYATMFAYRRYPGR